MIVVDTTVLVYALGVDHPLRQPCRRLVEAVGAGRLNAVTTVEVVQEFTHVRARRRGRAEAAERGAELAVLLAPLLRPDADDLRSGLELFGSNEGIGAFDAVLAATAMGDRRVEGLVSADTAFASVAGLVHIDPAAPDFLAVLGLVPS